MTSAVVGFDDPEFNAIVWLNHVLAQPRRNPNDRPSPTFSSGSTDSADIAALDAAAIDLAIDARIAELEETASNAHACLHEDLVRALTAVPWAVREADRVRQRATSLRAGVDGVGERVAGVETAVSTAVATVAHADTLLIHVENVAHLLAQAAAADTLLERLDSLLLASSAADGSDLVSAADVVAELRATLAPLRSIPDLAQRFEQLGTADRKLETLAAPRLKDALITRNAAAASNAKIVFDRAGRENAFATHYVSIRARQVVDLWTTAWSLGSLPSDIPASANAPHHVPADSEFDGQTADKNDALEHTIGLNNSANQNASAGPVQLISAIPRPKTRSPDLSSTQAAVNLDNFYEQLLKFLVTESEWMKTSFPKLRSHLLPSLLATALTELSSPSIADLTPNPRSISISGLTRLHNIALRSVRMAAELARLFQSIAMHDLGSNSQAHGANQGVSFSMSLDGSLAAHGLVDVVYDALAAVLFPSRLFWELWPNIAALSANVAALEIPMEFSGRVALSDIAKRVEMARTPLLESLEFLMVHSRDWTSGLGVLAIPKATAMCSSTFADRVLDALSLESSGASTSSIGVDWNRVAGALRLLTAVANLKAIWENRKEAGIASSAGLASNVIEQASFLAQNSSGRISFLVECGDAGRWTDASAVWELTCDKTLSAKVTRAFELNGDTTGDFQGLLHHVHVVVYNCMFEGIRQLLGTMPHQKLWNEDVSSDAQESSMSGFSSSPLPYATDIADLLMTIPQQLEPFVPDDDELKKYMIPPSLHFFRSIPGFRKEVNAEVSMASVTDVVDSSKSVGAEHASLMDLSSGVEGASRSFAGMWIGAISVGTMELYVRKILEIPRLREAGSRQLSIDLEYVCNVLGALGVLPTEDISIIRRAVECAPDRATLCALHDELENSEHQKILDHVAALRGINVTD